MPQGLVPLLQLLGLIMACFCDTHFRFCWPGQGRSRPHCRVTTTDRLPLNPAGFRTFPLQEKKCKGSSEDLHLILSIAFQQRPTTPDKAGWCLSFSLRHPPESRKGSGSLLFSATGRPAASSAGPSSASHAKQVALVSGWGA